MKMYSFIKLSHLPALGVEERYFLIVLLAIGIILAYTVIQPFISWLVSLKLTRLISYIVSSLVIFVIVNLYIIWKPEMAESMLIAVGIVCQIIALFGVTLTIYYMVRKLMNRI